MPVMYRCMKFFILALMAACGFQSGLAADSLPLPSVAPLQFGVLNQQSTVQTAERWNPILRYLTQKTGIPLKLKMGATVEQTDAMMGREEFDLVFTNHSFQTEYDGKYNVLARWAGKPIHGVLVVLEESPIRQMSELQGLVVGFPSSDAFVAYAVPRVVLKEAGVAVTEKFTGNQDGALAQLKARQVQAVAVNSRFLEQFARREQLKYRVIHQSEGFHELPVMIHPRVPARQAAELKQAMLGMQQDPAATALREGYCPGFEHAEDRDYDNVRLIYRRIGQ